MWQLFPKPLSFQPRLWLMGEWGAALKTGQCFLGCETKGLCAGGCSRACVSRQVTSAPHPALRNWGDFP